MMSSWLGASLLGVLALAQAQEPAPRSKPHSLEIAEDGTVTVRGTARFTDADHVVHENTRGTARAMLWYADEKVQMGTGAEFQIVDGAWTITFHRPEHAGKHPARVSIHECTVDDCAVINETDSLPLAEGKEFVLRLHAIPELRLRVFDAGTKEDLDRVEVFRSESGGAGTLHPGSADVRSLVAGAKSPLVVPPPERVSAGTSGKLWIRVPGYAWSTLEVMFAEGGQREAALVRGGAVRVAISGEPPKRGKTAIRFYPPETGAHDPLLELAGRTARENAIEDIAPGKYEARLELGDWFREPRVLARAAVEVQAGKTATVELAIPKDVAEPDHARLRGILAMPTGWKRANQGMSVALDPLSDTAGWTEAQWVHEHEMGSAKDGEYRFAFADIVVGRYVLTVQPSHYQQVVEVGKGGIL